MDPHSKRKGIFAGLLELLGEDDDSAEFPVKQAKESPSEATAAAESPEEAEVEAPIPSVDPEPFVGATADEAVAPTAPAVVDPVIERPTDSSVPELAVPSVEPTLEPPRADPPPAPVRQPDPEPVRIEPTLEDHRLSSPDPSTRLVALRELAGSDMVSATASIVDRVTNDPQAEIRLEALELLARIPTATTVDILRSKLKDPADAVRARAAELLESAGPAAIPDLIRLVGLRRWPQTQRTVLEALPRLIAASPLDDTQLADLLDRVARLDSPALASERSGFGALARVCGTQRIIASLSLQDHKRLGAARLLVEEGSAEALRAVAAFNADPMEEMRVAAGFAQSMMTNDPGFIAETTATPAAPTTPVPMPLPQVPASRPVVQPYESRPSIGGDTRVELVAGLARALSDPDEAVRSRAREALVKAQGGTVVGWVKAQLREGDQGKAESAALVVEELRILDAAPELLERAAGLPAELRGTFVAALASLHLDPATLAGLTRSVEASRRHEAIRLVGELGGTEVVDHLRPFLSDSSGPVRMAALELIGRAPDRDTAALAKAILERDSSPAVRASAVKVIGAVQDPEIRLEALAAALDDPDPDVRATAVEMLSGESAAASPLLLKAAGDDDERVRMAASRFLTDLRHGVGFVWSALLQAPEHNREDLLSVLEERGPEDLAALAASHLESSNSDDRALAVAIAGRAGTPESIKRAILALQDPAPGVRATAAKALSQVRTSEAIPALGRALSDPHAEVRIQVVHALGVIDDDDVIPVLIASMKDPERRVRDQSAAVLERWRSPAVARRLVESLAAPDLSRAAADLLARMGQTALEPLLEQLGSGDAELMGLVGELLSNLVGPQPFLEDLDALEPAVRTRAVEALGAIGGLPAVDGLIRALSDPDSAIRRLALARLARLGDPRAYDAVRQTFATDPVQDVMEAAEQTLKALAPRSDPGV